MVWPEGLMTETETESWSERWEGLGWIESSAKDKDSPLPLGTGKTVLWEKRRLKERTGLAGREKVCRMR